MYEIFLETKTIVETTLHVQKNAIKQKSLQINIIRVEYMSTL